MNSDPCRRIKLSCRSNQSTGRMSPDVDFTLYGSPAPRCSHRSTPIKPRKPTQPPNTPNGSLKPRKPLRLPIEKILLLNEKIENSKREKIRLELSSRQIKLLSEREDDRHCPDSSKTSSSTVDLSIDLSTVTNSDRESDENSDDPEEYFPQAMLPKEKERSESSTETESPSRHVWRMESPKKGFSPGSERSAATEYPCSVATKSSESNVTNRSVTNQSPKCFRSRSADLIHLYVSTVSHKDKLTKYFRPCHVCNQPCCICPDLVPESSRSFPMFYGKPPINSLLETAKCSIDKQVETDPVITEFANPIPPVAEPESDSSDSEFSNFLIERYLNKSTEGYRNDSDAVFDSGNSTLQLNESGRSIGKKSIPLSVIQLATAAQCARILANSLESVLEIVDGEAEDCRELVRFKGDDLNQLFESLLSLKSHYAEEGSREWIGFRGNDETCSRQERTTSLDIAFPGPASTGQFCFEDNFDGDTLSRMTFSGGNASE